MSRSTSRCSNKHRPERGPGAGLLSRLLPLLLLLALAVGGCKTVSAPSKPTLEVEDRFVFHVFNPALQPIAGAEIRVDLEAGESLVPLPLITDEAGQAVLRVRAREDDLVPGVDSQDKLLKYRSTIAYRILAPGRLPGWGRTELNDSYEEFTRPAFSAVLNAKPRNKTLPLRHVLYRTEDFFAPEALKDPLARTLAKGLRSLWRTWSFTGRLERLKPTLASLEVVRHREGPYLKLGLDLDNALEFTEDSSVHEFYSTELIPVLDDLAFLYAPLVSGWDITFNLAYRPQGDPHAMAVNKPLRLVFSEQTRSSLLGKPGGLNWLIPEAQVCTLDDKPWKPLEMLAREDQRHDYLWETMPVFFVPGSGNTASTAEIKDTSEEPLPVSPGPF